MLRMDANSGGDPGSSVRRAKGPLEPRCLTTSLTLDPGSALPSDQVRGSLGRDDEVVVSLAGADFTNVDLYGVNLKSVDGLNSVRDAGGT